VSKMYHISTNINGWLRLPMKEKRKSLLWLTKDNGIQFSSVSELEAEFLKAKDSGYEVVPVCDNIDSKGRCQGHEEKEAAGEQ
jgi:hypothetical protein